MDGDGPTLSVKYILASFKLQMRDKDKYIYVMHITRFLNICSDCRSKMPRLPPTVT